MVENKEKGYSELMRTLYSHTGNAFIIGVTGPPGTGKSSVIDPLVRAYRQRKENVAVLAIDPSSPITGGAILGDRVRMLDHSLDEHVYIRSMAAKGNAGGLSKSTRNAARVLDAAGFDLIFIETVGIGQADVEVARVADCVLVVLMPELGDEVQAIKAGLMEVGDIFIINKSDLGGSDMILAEIQSALTTKQDGWNQTILKVSAKTSNGINELVDTIEKQRTHTKSDAWSKRITDRLRFELITGVADRVSENIRSQLVKDRQCEKLLLKVQAKEIDPDTATNLILKKYMHNKHA